MTFKPVIWSRIHARMGGLGLPKLPVHPSMHPFCLNGDREYEHLVARAVLFHDSWRSETPRDVHITSARIPRLQIQRMAMLPGGNFAVASATSSIGTHYLAFLRVDGGNTKVLGKVKLPGKCLDVQATWTNYQEEDGITVAFSQRMAGPSA